MSFHLQQGVCHIVALPFTLKSILRQEKNYRNSNISPCKNIIFQKSSKRNQNPSRYYNSITNLKFPTQTKILPFKKSSYKNRPIIIIITQGQKSVKLLYSIMNLNTISLPSWQARPTNIDKNRHYCAQTSCSCCYPLFLIEPHN